MSPRSTSVIIFAIRLAALSLSAGACKGSALSAADEPPRSVTVEPLPPPSKAQGGELAIGDPTAAPAPAAPNLPPVHGLPQLGAACPPPSADPLRGGVIEPCGSKGRVSLRWAAHSARSAFTATPPCTLVSVEKKQAGAPQPGFGEARRACAQDGVLYAASVCMMCRLPTAGWSAVGVIAELTKVQSLALQEKLGLPTTAPLATTEAWHAAIAAAST